jgi:hypothetical protein
MDFADKTGILGQCWIDFRDDENFKTFNEYNDIGLPMAYYVAEGLVKELTPLGEQYIDESFKMLLDVLEVEEKEIEFLPDKNLGSILVFAYNKQKFKEKPE